MEMEVPSGQPCVSPSSQRSFHFEREPGGESLAQVTMATCKVFHNGLEGC